MLKDLLKIAEENNATDIHIEIRNKYAEILFRIYGMMHLWISMPASKVSEHIAAAYTINAQEESRSDASFNSKIAQHATIPVNYNNAILNLRYQSHPVVDGCSIVLRILKSSSPPVLSHLNYNKTTLDNIYHAINKHYGGIFVSGTTGSGKTTSIMSMIIEISKLYPNKKIYTIEDPMEYKISGVSHMQVTTSTPDYIDNKFMAPMLSLLRMDPYVCMIGGIRDKATADVVTLAIETGNQILSTIHANSSLSIIKRLLSPELNISISTLLELGFMSLCIHQKLISKLCPNCKLKATDCTANLNILDEIIDVTNVYVENSRGCSNCRHPEFNYHANAKLGFKGLYLIAESFIPNPYILQTIATNPLSIGLKLDLLEETDLMMAFYKIEHGIISANELSKHFSSEEINACIHKIKRRRNQCSTER